MSEKVYFLSVLFCIGMSVIGGEIAVDKKFLKTLPKAEQAMKDEVDHWGLPFSDQLRRFLNGRAVLEKQLGGKAPEKFIIGLQDSLTKIPLNKYWFKGKYSNEIDLSAAKNEYESFQIAVLPEIGKTLEKVSLTVRPPGLSGEKGKIVAENIRIYRVAYVDTANTGARYPSLYKGMWPDILLPYEPIKISGTDAGVFWVEIKVPKDCAAGNYAGEFELRADNETLPVKIRLRVYDFALPDRVPFPLAVWTSPVLPWGEKMSPEKYRELAGEFLKHGIDPLCLGRDFCSLKNNDFRILDENLEYGLARGLQVFEIPGNKKPEDLKSYIDHIREKGWGDKALVYLGPDEPTESTFKKVNIPRYQKFHNLYPNIKKFLATEYHPDIDKGCDVWLTDVSTAKGAEFASANRGKAKLWFYFCHLPIHIDYCRPLVQAPNMQIDNEAVEHRLALWLCWKYHTDGMFIWAGNREWKKPDIDRRDWEHKGWQLPSKPYGFPYGGIHNGNGYLIYPGPAPSIRMKVLRDGLEDYGYLLALEKALPRIKNKEDIRKAKAILQVPVQVLVNAHYFNRDPQGILQTRAEIGEILSRLPEK
jgi:hypothetical protein